VLTALLATFSLGSTQKTSPISDDQAVFDAIPEQTRGFFVARLHSVVLFQGAHDWNSLYELLAEPDPKVKVDFIAHWKKFDRPDAFYALELKPDHLMKLSETSQQKYQWIVSGCAKYRIADRVEHHQSSMYALFRDGSWYFSELMINIRCGPNDPDPCQQEHSRAKNS
jgi:hypothetical protein